MKLDISEKESQLAKRPHNLFMLNLALCHLLMTPAAIALDIGLWGMLLPLSFSLSIILFTWLHSNNIQQAGNQFVYLHWKLAVKRYSYLLISYGATFFLLAIGMLVAMTTPDTHMQHILQTVFVRIAIMPVLIMVMINFYLESNAINLATAGEIPDALLKQYSPESQPGE